MNGAIELPKARARPSALAPAATPSGAAEGPTTSYVVARRDLPVGTRLTAGDLTRMPMELPGVDKGARWDPAELSEVVPALLATDGDDAPD